MNILNKSVIVSTMFFSMVGLVFANSSVPQPEKKDKIKAVQECNEKFNTEYKRTPNKEEMDNCLKDKGINPEEMAPNENEGSTKVHKDNDKDK